MAFGRRNSLGTIVNSRKHVVDVEGAWTDAVSASVILVAVNRFGASISPTEVEVGNKVNGIFLSIYAIGSSGAPISGPIDWHVFLERAGQASAAPTPGNVGISEIRNQVIHEEKGLSGSGDGTPMVFKGVIAIPKGFRRIRDGDQWSIRAQVNTGDTVNFCIKCIYKSFS